MSPELGFSFLDHYFSNFLAGQCGLSGGAKERFRDMVARVSAALGEGHSCLPLSAEDISFLRGNPLVSDGEYTPLVLHNRRLYLHRYYHYETRLAVQISRMATSRVAVTAGDDLVNRYFANTGPDTDWQREAARIALTRPLAIICGGPGTGKTTTVARILALLLETTDGGERLTIALAAPTGKAAMRLSEAITKSLAGLDLRESLRRAIPGRAATLHRLLGVRHGSPQFRHHRENPLVWDIIVVDEASMVDLAMMSKLVDAIKPGARLLLLGDKDQLASVESGAVLGDLIRSLPDNTVELQKTYRFEEAIKQLAAAIKRADSSAVWDHLNDSQWQNVSRVEGNLIAYICERYEPYMAMIRHADAENTDEIFKLFNMFQVLCAVHFGARGVESINKQVELTLVRRGFPCRPESWYPGRPVLITCNDYGLELFNGDIGICLPDRGSGTLRVWFEQADGGFRPYPPARLPRCETVFAMTIHKSQGAEFDEVLVVLPETDTRILSRELLYTAVTRAKKAVRLAVGPDVLSQTLARNIVRVSGLADALQQQPLQGPRGKA